MSETYNKKTDTEKFEDEPLVFGSDIYSLAFAALIHPESYKHSVNKPMHIPQITMLNYEREVLFSGAVSVAFMQALYLYILYTFIAKLEIQPV